MSKLRVHSFAISVDGYGAGPNQELSNPIGIGGIALHQWIFATRTFHEMTGRARAAIRASMMTLWRAVSQILGLASWVGTCSGRLVDQFLLTQSSCLTSSDVR